MMTAAEIIDALGGATAIGREIGAPTTTVHGWKRTGSVPAWRIDALVDLAKRQGKSISADHLASARKGRAA